MCRERYRARRGRPPKTPKTTRAGGERESRYEKIKDTAVELEQHYWFNKNKYVRLFDKNDLEKYLDVFDILKIDEKETVRFEHKKNYLIFFAKKK